LRARPKQLRGVADGRRKPVRSSIVTVAAWACAIVASRRRASPPCERRTVSRQAPTWPSKPTWSSAPATPCRRLSVEGKGGRAGPTAN
jgi:hypothetical protein